MSGEIKEFPVDRLSYSSFIQLLRNPLIFKLKHMLEVYDDMSSVSRMIGNAGHEALRFYYGGDPDRPVPADRAEARGLALETGLKYINDFPDAYIDYGKTGSREKILTGYKQAMDFYWAEEPVYDEVLICEEKMTAEITNLEGQKFPLPAVAKPDLVVKEKDGAVDIVDAKFVTAFTDTGSEDYIKIIQAMFIEHVLRAAKGIKARRCIFREIKRTLNTDPKTKKPNGTPQVRDYVIPLDHEPYRIIFTNLYQDVVAFLGNNPIFLPNLGDQFDGAHAGEMYAQGLISSDMSDVEVMHKVRDVAFVSKKFVASRLDREENKDLLPEERVRIALWDMGIPVEPVETKVGAGVTQYRFKVSAGVSMARIKKHKDDIARALRTTGEVVIRAPIPGTDLVGVEVENKVRGEVKLTKDLYRPDTLSLPLGVDVHGNVVYLELDKAPHVLVGGTTGSGKSVLMANLITALTAQKTPEELELTLIDPKRVELAPFARKPHLHGKRVIFEYEDALRALMELVEAMEDRYRALEKAGKVDIAEFNASKRNADLRMRYKVVVVDEFADFMLRSKKEESRKGGGPNYGPKTKRWLYKEALKRAGKPGLEVPYEEDASRTHRVKIAGYHEYDKSELTELLEANDLLNPVLGVTIEPLIVRLAQMGRAAGIHLVLGTQKPTVDVVTGLIKANMPTRIALMTASVSDSKVILDVPGAEKLAGKGDLIFRFPGNRGDVRLQAFAKK